MIQFIVWQYYSYPSVFRFFVKISLVWLRIYQTQMNYIILLSVKLTKIALIVV